MKKLVVCALCAAMVIPAMSVSVSADSKELGTLHLGRHVPAGSTGWF